MRSFRGSWGELIVPYSGEVVTLFAVLVVPNLLAGTVVGSVQWYGFWRGAVPIIPWVLLSIIGWAIVIMVPMLFPMTSDNPLTDTLYIVVSRATLGALIGLWQWMFLRKHLDGAQWWIAISAGTTAIVWLAFQAFL